MYFAGRRRLMAREVAEEGAGGVEAVEAVESGEGEEVPGSNFLDFRNNFVVWWNNVVAWRSTVVVLRCRLPGCVRLGVPSTIHRVLPLCAWSSRSRDHSRSRSCRRSSKSNGQLVVGRW